MGIIVGVFFLGVLRVCGGIHTRLLRAAREDIAQAPDCVHAILQCSFAYTPLTTGQFGGTFFESEQELDQVCRLNRNFIECIENAEGFCKEGGIEMVESVMIENRLYVRDLCAENSDWKNLYMKYGRCINKELSLVTEHCNLRIPVPPSDAEMESMCTYLDDLTECKANILSDRCGDNAGNIFRRITLLNGGREYLCSRHKNKQVESSPVLLAAQMLSSVRSLMKNLSDIFRESMGTEFLEEIDLMDPNLENPFEIDMGEFVRMMKGEFREDASDILYDGGHDTEQPPLNIDGDMPKDETAKSEGLFENVTETPKNYHTYSDMTDKIKDDKLENGANSQTEIKEPKVDQPSCKVFDGKEIPSSKNNASLNLYEISDLGQKNLLGSGLALVQWKTFQNTPLDDLFCSWMDQGSSSRLFRCALQLTELKTAQQPKPSIPVTLSLYTPMDTAQQSEEITLSKLANICLENYEPSEDVSIETEEFYEPKSILKEYMHDNDIHRSGQQWNEKTSNENDGNPSKSSGLTKEIFTINDDHEIIYKDSIEINAKEIFEDESEDELVVMVNSNFGHASTEQQEIKAKSNDAEDKFSYYDEKDNLNHAHLYDQIWEEEAFEGFPEFVSSDYVSNDPQTCQVERNSDCPKSDSKDKEDSTELKHDMFRHDVYSDAEHIEMYGPTKRYVRQEKDNPSIAKVEVFDIEDYTHADALEKIIEDVIDNIFAEQI